MNVRTDLPASSAVTHWHALEPEAALDQLGSDPLHGLAEAEALRRQAQFGPNQLTPRKGKGALLLFLSQFHQPLVYILLASAAITAFLREWVDSGVIFGVVLVNAIVGFIQEANALKAIEALSRSLSVAANVLAVAPGVSFPPRNQSQGTSCSSCPGTRSRRTSASSACGSCKSTNRP